MRGIAILLVLTACASSPRRPGEQPRDRTGDPEFEAAVMAADREFETQADALAAGVYEPFVHPDSIGVAPGRTVQRPPATPAPAAPPVDFGPGDPSTEELLGTLDSTPTYNQSREPPSSDSLWTVQAGAFGAETGAFVRLRQLERDFPDLPRWHVVDGGLFRVYVGRFANRADADRVLGRMADRGYGDAWVAPAP